MLRPVGTPTTIPPSPPHHMVETINEALVKTLPATSSARIGPRLGWATKRGLDTAVALTALCLLLPLLLFIALLIWASDGHAPIFRHVRLGRHGRPFGCLKFRSMVPDGDAVLAAHLAAHPDARAEWAATHKLTRDPRVTALGQVLRKSSLDELPQLWNIVRGDMSLVGPRPLLPAYLPLYSPRQARRHLVRPGLTGWAQVNGRNAIAWEEKFELDNWYVDNQSFWLDLRILARTAGRVLGRRGIAAAGEATMPAFRGSERVGE